MSRIIRKHAIRAEQIRAARALINWSRERLSKESRVPMRTLARIEPGQLCTRGDALERIQKTLEKVGIKFIDGNKPGVRLAQDPKP